jgi:hypothetical protein
MLKSNTTLEILSLEWNQLASTGASLIAQSLEHNGHLTHLDLRNNGISDDGAAAIAGALLNNSTIKVIDLRWNQITDDGAKAFEIPLSKRTTRLSLLITGNMISSKYMSLITEWTSNIRDADSVTQTTNTASPQPPPVEIVKHNFDAQNEELKRENERLRNELSSQNDLMCDLQRQLDVSALKITELEQESYRNNFRITQLDDALKLSRSKASEEQTAYRVSVANWEKERHMFMEEKAQLTNQHEGEIKGLIADRDSYRERLRICNVSGYI